MPHSLKLEIPEAETQQPTRLENPAHILQHQWQTFKPPTADTFNPQIYSPLSVQPQQQNSTAPCAPAQLPPSEPEPPPISPIDPQDVLEQLLKVPTSKLSALPAPTFISRPPPVPISESENADAIALRSAISLLQLQRDKSKKDLQILEKARQAALRDPEGFVEAAKKRVAAKSKRNGGNDPLAPTLQDKVAKLSKLQSQGVTAQGDGSEGQDQPKAKAERNARKDSHTSRRSSTCSSTSSEASVPDPAGDEFPVMPAAQNVIRCPPINWTKYHIAGDMLDKIHAEEVARPSLGQPEGFTPATGKASLGSSYGFPSAHPVTGRNPAYVLAAPYSPLTDVITPQQHGMSGVATAGDAIHPMQTRKGSKKPAA